MLAVIIFHILILSSVKAKFKSLNCTLFDKDFGEFVLCKLKAINRFRNSMSVQYRQNQQINNLYVRIEIFKRANGWRPFLYNFSVNLCDFLNNRNNPIMNIGYGLLKPYLDRNLSCPIKANEIIRCDNLEFEWKQLRDRFPVETGEYKLQLSAYHLKKLKITINLSSEYSNYKEH